MRPKIVFTIASLYLAAHMFVSQGCTPIRRFVRRVTPGTHYVVKPGDSIWEVAKIHDMPMHIIIDANKNLSSKRLKVGDKIYIPKYRGNEQVTPRKRVASKDKKHRKKHVDNDKRSIVLKWPVVNGVQFRNFSEDPDDLYEGIAIGAPEGTNVRASAAGKVIFIGDHGSNYGNVVIVQNKDPFVTIYAHLSKIKVKQGQQLKSGQVLGEVGVSGGVESPRVQLQVRKDRIAVDPKLYLN